MKTTRRTIAALAIATTGLTGLVGTASATASAAPHGTSTSATTVKTRAQVPWSSVGTGWVAGTVERGGSTHLVLVSPAGQPYDIATLAQGETVSAISMDGKHVVTRRSSEEGAGAPRIWDLQSGKAANLPTSLESLQFTRPTGSAVMGFNEVGSYGRYSLSGTQQVVKPGAIGTDEGQILPNSTGTTDAVTRWGKDGPRISLYTHSTFDKQRTYSLPSGAQGCYATGWQDSSTLIESCIMKQQGEATLTEAYAQKIDGGAPTALTSGTVPGSSTWTGYSDVVKTSVGTLARGQNETLYTLKGTKGNSRISLPQVNTNGSGATLFDVVGDQVLYAPGMGQGDSKATVAEYDLAKKKLTYLLGNNSSYTGTVTGFVAIDPRR